MMSDPDNQNAIQPLTAEKLVLSGGETDPQQRPEFLTEGENSRKNQATGCSANSGLTSGRKMVDNRYRSVVKAISWRVTGTLDTMVVSFLVTGRLKLALSIGFVELFTKIGLYYLHERVWNKIRFGREKATEDYEI